ncbi:hypothetical protein BH10PSE19_BH10PSE19_18120 [soil metagenome]
MHKRFLHFNFSTNKNQQLIKERGISFEEIIAAIDDGDPLLDVLNHPNQEKYPHQEMLVVQIRDYIYIVPFVMESEDSAFLKTIIPSRKAKKRYLQGREEHE